MKRTELIRRLVANGCHLKRHGKRHDLYENPRNGRVAPIPRHTEIRNTLYGEIRKQLGLG